jgi:hypothetical protein
MLVLLKKFKGRDYGKIRLKVHYLQWDTVLAYLYLNFLRQFFVRTGCAEATKMNPTDGEDIGSQGFLIFSYCCIVIWWVCMVK